MRHKPADHASDGEADTRRRGIDQKILQPRMVTGRPQLHYLEQADQDDRHRRDKQAPLRKREADGETN